MFANKTILQRVYRFFAILIILGLAWAGFLWLTQAPPVDAIPSLLMVWTTAIILLLAFFPFCIEQRWQVQSRGIGI